MSLNYNYVDVKTELVEELRNHVDSKIRVLKSDPREPSEIPCIGINRAGDDEQNQVLGDDFGVVFDEALNKHVSYKGTFFNETMEIRVWHSNADERDKLYILVKAVLVNIRDFLVEMGLRNLKLSGGRDEQENNFPPHPLYWSTINMNYLNPMEIEVIEHETIESVDILTKDSDIDFTASDKLIVQTEEETSL